MDVLSMLRNDPAVVRAEQAQAPEEYAQTAQLYTFRYRSASEEVEGMLAVPADLDGPGPVPHAAGHGLPACGCGICRHRQPVPRVQRQHRL